MADIFSVMDAIRKRKRDQEEAAGMSAPQKTTPVPKQSTTPATQSGDDEFEKQKRAWEKKYGRKWTD